MKKLSMLILLLVFIIVSACNSVGDKCHIVGHVNNPNLEGKYIFLIAEDNSIREEVGIDSVAIKDQTFEFTTDKNMMCILRMDWHFRYGVQDLLVVAEPGELDVTIDSISSCHGTPSNNVLQQWKEMTQVHMKQYGQLQQMYQAAHFSGDTIRRNSIKHNADSIHSEYIERTHTMTAGLPDESPLKDFLKKLYP